MKMPKFIVHLRNHAFERIHDVGAFPFLVVSEDTGAYYQHHQNDRQP